VDPARILRTKPANAPRRAQEQVPGDDDGEQPESAHHNAEKVRAGLGDEVHRSVEAEQVVDRGLQPLGRRVVGLQAAADRDIGEANDDVGHGEAEENPHRAPAGPRVAGRVELAAVDPQQDQQNRGADRAHEVVPVWQ